MSMSAFVDKYFECVDSMPQDLQRLVTRLREIELEKRDLVLETERLRCELVKAVESGNRRQLLLFRKLQECLLEVREIGNSKLEISAQMLDIVEEYRQQLGLCAKEIETNPRSEELFHTPRQNSLQYSTIKSDSPVSNGHPESKSSAKRTSSSKRPRQPASMGDKGHEEDSGLFLNGGSVGREGGAYRGKESSLSTMVVTGGTTNISNGKPPKKKVKTVKKSSRVAVSKDKETTPTAPPPAHVPMPDLTSQPLDPDEPTYCLCQQVSFGEMIGCDNDDCQIEWFHFQCVGLTSKPKGKWYCPNCTQERKARSTK